MLYILTIEREEDTYSVLRNSMTSKKSFEYKKALFEHNLYKLDGKSSERVAGVIKRIC